MPILLLVKAIQSEKKTSIFKLWLSIFYHQVADSFISILAYFSKTDGCRLLTTDMGCRCSVISLISIATYFSKTDGFRLLTTDMGCRCSMISLISIVAYFRWLSTIDYRYGLSL